MILAALISGLIVYGLSWSVGYVSGFLYFAMHRAMGTQISFHQMGYRIAVIDAAMAYATATMVLALRIMYR